MAMNMKRKTSQGMFPSTNATQSPVSDAGRTRRMTSQLVRVTTSKWRRRHDVRTTTQARKVKLDRGLANAHR